jgi:hypothetical protein
MCATRCASAMTAAEFLHTLRRYRHLIPKQTLLTLRGQALAGDVDGAMHGLTHILKKSA